jgi:serine/threonine protein kinase
MAKAQDHRGDRPNWGDGKSVGPATREGSVGGGRYSIVRALGEGGLGTVYEAVDVLMAKRVAIKVMRSSLIDRDGARERLLLEASTTARIGHPNVVKILDVLQEQESLAVVMELLQGESLAFQLARAPLSYDQLLDLLLPAMRGVCAAHAKGVIHGDITPANIFLARHADGDVVPTVIGFGLAFEKRSPGTIVGNPHYLAHEQLLGALNVDERADVHAFGVMLYEGLTGRSPYEDESFAGLLALRLTATPAAPRALRGVPEELSRLVMAALAREPDDRIRSLREMIWQLEHLCREEASSRSSGRA